MADSMLEQEIEVYSDKYDVHGVVKDYGVVTKLFFSYAGKETVMGITRNPLIGEQFEEIGRELIDSYVSNLASCDGGRKLQFHYWYLDQQEIDGRTFTFGHGIVTGHKRLSDSIRSHTSAVQAIHIDEEAKEAVITTKNSVYHCPLAYWRFDKQDAFPDIVPEYEELKKKYQGTIDYPSIESGKVLLVLANFCDYYFHSIYYVPEGSKDGKPLPFNKYAHIGTFQDSYLVWVEGTGIDLRYFPHFQNIEFYDESTEDKPLFIENIGDCVLYVGTHCGTIRLEPGERKEVSEENAENEKPTLPRGDLYPAGVME